MISKIIIADASPLIAFGRIHSLTLLSDTLGNIIIPQAVADECVTDISRPGASEIQNAIHNNLITVHSNRGFVDYHGLQDILGMGEAAAIALAVELDAGLLIDERLGRKAAKKLHLKVIGTAGVLLLAKQRKLIKKIFPIIQALKESGYYLSADLIKEVLEQAQECV